jgi:heme ABC exporter ATP-binding subunit CcmA
MIETRDLTVVFGRTTAIDSLDLNLNLGVTGLFGQNGSGKSTLLKVIAGLLRPTRGSLSLFGVASDDVDEDFRRNIGYVGHEPGLYERLTIAENLEFFAQMYGVKPARIPDVIQQLGLGERAGTRVDALSAGYSRRAAVARALLHEPTILLLDEPYANLDDDASALVSAAVKGWRETGTGDRLAIVATHGAKKVKAYADAGVILQRGRLVKQGTYQRDGVRV